MPLTVAAQMSMVSMAILARGSLSDVIQIEIILFMVALPKGAKAIIVIAVIDISTVA
jgi:hypothetical protein